MNDPYAGSPAEIYHRHFVPALFRQWGEILADAAEIGWAERVLDVACGTGTLACAAARRTGGGGRVVGLDISEEMLAVARREHPGIDWRLGRAEALPFEPHSFDVVVSQFGFMFFEDQAAALGEMMRVLRPGGRMAVAVCDALDHSPGYAVLAELLHRLFGDAVAQAFRAPFSCGEPERLLACSEQAGLAEAGRADGLRVARYDGMVRFGSVDDLVSSERACAWTLGGLLGEAQFERLAAEAQASFRPFVQPDGSVAFSMPVLILSAIKPAKAAGRPPGADHPPLQ